MSSSGSLPFDESVGGISTSRRLEADPRTLMQAAKLAIHDVFDAVIELVTNSDDRYQYLGIDGSIEICIERRRGNKPSVLQVRDFADGMTAEVMEEKLSRVGGRVSGMEEGFDVRGTNSRGAKDVAALGDVTFESIAKDGKYHKCRITRFFDFVQFPSKEVDESLREALGIQEGTGTLVSIEVLPEHQVPRHDNLRRKLSSLVALREILRDPRRTVELIDLNQDRRNVLEAPELSGVIRVNDSFEIPGYEPIKAKLVIKRASRPFERANPRFRLGGIAVRSKRAVHEATLFDSALETDPHAAWFFGHLACPGIDDLLNEYDDRFEAKDEFDPANPCPIIDPSRKAGLTREHPFVKELVGQALIRLRPLVEEERKRAESEKSTIESQKTRKRLNRLEKAASKFIQESRAEDEAIRDPDSVIFGSKFRDKGYALQPPYCQILQGHSRLFWFNLNQAVFPEFDVGSALSIECLSDEISASKRVCGMEAHPSHAGILRAVWKVRGETPTAATGVRVRLGSINAESAVEVFLSPADRFAWVDSLTFERKRYQVRTKASRKKVRILAPLTMVAQDLEIQVECSSRHFKVSGSRVLHRNEKLGVAICELHIRSDGTEDIGHLEASLGDLTATADIRGVAPPGASLKIKIEDIDLENQRYRLRQNVLEIAARHPSVKRYLGPKVEGFPGQETAHFRLLIAEIVSEAVCADIVARNTQDSPDEYDDADWDRYYAEYSQLMTQFLPIAHQLQCPEGG